MSRHGLTRIEGTVAGSLAAGQFNVDLPNGHSITARISARLRRLHFKVTVGDRVLIGMSPYGQTHGLIMTRATALVKAGS